jgi:hypothetical protein
MNEILVAAVDNNNDKPSLIELVIIDGIYDSIKPVFNHVVRVVAESTSTLSLIEKSEQIYFWFVLLLQSYSLYKFDAPILEKLYGIKYKDATLHSEGGEQRLKTWKKVCALASIVVMPNIAKFLREKSIAYRKNNTNRNRDTGNNSTGSKILNFTKTLFGVSMPYIDQLYVLIDSLHSVGYTIGSSMYYKLFWRILNLTAARNKNSVISSVIDNTSQGSASNIGPSKIIDKVDTTLSSMNIPMSVSSTSNVSIFDKFSRVTKVFGAGVSILFLIKLVQVYTENQNQSSERSSDEFRGFDADLSRSGAASNRDLGTEYDRFPPPTIPQVGRGCIVPPSQGGLCPICRCPRSQPSSSTGGYVFCYSCLSNYIRKYGNICPVTGAFCRLEDIVRLYGDSS